MVKEPDLSPYAAFTAAFGTLLAPELAQYIAAYGIILIGWFAGSLWGVYKRAPESRMPVWAYVLSTLLVALGVTTTIAGIMTRVFPDLPVVTLLFPIAWAIPAYPERWSEFAAWALDRVNARRGAKS
jgi:hypothetical protein